MFDPIVYQAIQNKFDPSQYTEHQAVNLAVNSTSLTTLMSVKGKGMLEEALVVGLEASCTTAPEIKITVDGVVILDLLDDSASNLSGVRGVMPSSDYEVTYSYLAGSEFWTCIRGLENTIGNQLSTYTGSSSAKNTTGLQKFTFPSAAQQSVAYSNFCGAVLLSNPIYFNSSLLVQIKGVVPSSGSICAVAKARY